MPTTATPRTNYPFFTSAALDERYYGNLQGLNKADTAAKYGEAQVMEWRRSYSTRPPGGREPGGYQTAG